MVGTKYDYLLTMRYFVNVLNKDVSFMDEIADKSENDKIA